MHKIAIGRYWEISGAVIDPEIIQKKAYNVDLH